MVNVIYSETTNQETLVAKFDDVDLSVVNALRRVLLTNIQSLVICGFPHDKSNIDIMKNNSKYNNEYIKHRLSCLPIYFNEMKVFRNFVDSYYIKIYCENDTNLPKLLTTEHFKLINKSTHKEYKSKKSIFDDGNPIPIIRLYPQISKNDPVECFEANITLKIGCAKEDNCWNMVSKCSYSYTQNNDKVGEEIDKIDKLDMDKDAKQLMKKDFQILDSQKEMYCIKNTYDFILETIGVYSNKKLMYLACDYIINTFKKLRKDTTEMIVDANLLVKEELDTLIYINNERNADKIKYIIQIEKDDYTIGKLIEKYLYTYYSNGESKKMKYIAFKKEHPHDDHCLIYIIYNETVEHNKKILIKDLQQIYDKIIKDFITIQENFDK